MPPESHFDPAQLDFATVVADREAIRRVNPQRFEMEQLDAIVKVDGQQHLLAGYKAVRADAFWVPGHIPNYPLWPAGLARCVLDVPGLPHPRRRGTTPPALPPVPLDWRAIFGNDHPVELEVGSGKGLFLTTAAAARPDLNFVGVEIVRKYQLFT